MTRTIKIISVEDTANTANTAGCGSGEGRRQQEKLAAGIDTDIFEADSLEAGGERFWEAYWKTQHVYGGVHEGQTLAEIFAGLDDAVFGKLREDIERIRVDHAGMGDAEKDDVFGMVMFLLGMERGDPLYNPLEHEGYEGAMARFAAAVGNEALRRGGR